MTNFEDRKGVKHSDIATIASAMAAGGSVVNPSNNNICIWFIYNQVVKFLENKNIYLINIY